MAYGSQAQRRGYGVLVTQEVTVTEKNTEPVTSSSTLLEVEGRAVREPWAPEPEAEEPKAEEPAATKKSRRRGKPVSENIDTAAAEIAKRAEELAKQVDAQLAGAEA